MKRKTFLLISFLCLAGTLLCGGVLEDNEKALVSRKIELSPTPKRIAFEKVVSLSKVVISGDAKLPFFETVCEEITSRFAELGAEKMVSVASAPEKGAYNIIISGNFKKPAGLPEMAAGCERELYTLTPGKNSIVLSGKENALYAAVTLRSLIVKNGKIIQLHPARVIDWPDFPVRRVTLANPFLYALMRDPDTAVKNIKPYIDMIFRAKINEIGHMPAGPGGYTMYRLNAKGPFLTPQAEKTIRSVSEYVRARNMKSGLIQGCFMLGSKKLDGSDPTFKGMHFWANDRYHSWARTDLYAKIARRYRDVMTRTKWNAVFVHAVDTGGAADPEHWSQRDEATRKRFGDDRAAADAAVFMEYHKALKGTGVDLEVVVYPYHGYYVTEKGVMYQQKFTDTPAMRKAAKAMADKNVAFLTRINSLLPKDIAIHLREGSSQQVRDFRKYIPGRSTLLYFETNNVSYSVVPLISPEYLNTVSCYDVKNPDKCCINRIDGDNLPALSVPFAQYTWNTSFKYSFDMDRSRNPLRYEPQRLEFLARYTANHFFGLEAGSYLYPLFDNLLSFVYAVDPFDAHKRCRTAFDLEKYLERNHKQICKALDGFEKVWAKRKNMTFKAGSYPFFVEYYKQLKAAKIYSDVHWTMARIKTTAAKGDMKGVKTLKAQCLARVKKDTAAWQKAALAWRNEPALTDWSKLSRWHRYSIYHCPNQLIAPDFKGLVKKLDDEEKNASVLFAKSNAPAFLKNISLRNRFIYSVSGNKVYTVRHWFNHKNLMLSLRKAEAVVRHTPKSLIFSAVIHSPGIEKAAVPKYKRGDWPLGESFEVILAPPGAEYSRYHYVAGSFGEFYAARIGKKPGDRFLRFDSKVVPQVKREKDIWRVTIEIPFAELNAKPGRNWKILLAVNNPDGSFSSAFANGKSFHEPSFYQNLLFTTGFNETPEAFEDISFNPNVKVFESRQHASGTGTWIECAPAFNTAMPVTVKKLTLTLLDEKKIPVSKPVTLRENSFVPVRFQPFEPVTFHTETELKGVWFKFDVQYEGGNRVFSKTQLFPWGKLNAVVPGPSAGKKASAAPYLSTYTPAKEKGSFTLWFKPEWDKRSWSADMVWLLHAGVAWKTFNWGNGIFFFYNRKWQTFELQITNRKYQKRNVIGSLNLKKGVWVKLECDWDFTGKAALMTIKADGKVISGKIMGRGSQAATEPLTFPGNKLAYPAFIGAQNNGNEPALGEICLEYK